MAAVKWPELEKLLSKKKILIEERVDDFLSHNEISIQIYIIKIMQLQKRLNIQAHIMSKKYVSKWNHHFILSQLAISAIGYVTATCPHIYLQFINFLSIYNFRNEILTVDERVYSYIMWKNHKLNAIYAVWVVVLIPAHGIVLLFVSFFLIAYNYIKIWWVQLKWM